MEGFRKEKSLLNGSGENDVVWRTTKNGVHYPIKDGETPKEAVQKRIKDIQVKEKYNSNPLENNVDKILKGEYKGAHLTLLEKPPKIFTEIGIPNLPLVITAKHTYLIINNNGKYNGRNDHYHNLGKELFMAIPKLLKTPLFIFKSAREKDVVIAVLGITDKQNNHIIVPIKINANATQKHMTITANLVKSIYGKSNLQKYIDDNVKEENMLSVANKKIRNYTP